MPWPISNRADSLDVDYFYLQRQIGHALTFSFEPAARDDVQEQVVQEIIDEGCRLWYWPPVLGQPWTWKTGESHTWSFMKPTLDVTTQDSQSVYPLPLEFERPAGPLVYSDVSGGVQSYHPIHITSATRVMYLQGQDNASTSPPVLAAIRVSESTGEAPQQQELLLYILLYQHLITLYKKLWINQCRGIMMLFQLHRL